MGTRGNAKISRFARDDNGLLSWLSSRTDVRDLVWKYRR